MALLYLLKNISSPILDIAAQGLACFGSDLFFLCVTAVIFWCFSKKAAYKLVFTYVLFTPVIYLANIIIRSPFPFSSYSVLSAPSFFTSHAAGYSLPSIGVFTITVLCAVIFINNFNIWVKIVCVIVTLITVFSYLYLAICSTWSAAISLVLGVAASALFSRFRDSYLFDNRQYPVYLGLSFIPTFLFLVVSVSMYLNGIITLGAFSCTLRVAGMNVALLFSWFFESNFVNFSIRCKKPSDQFLKALSGTAGTLITWFGLYFLFNLIPGFWPAAFICNTLTALGAFSAFTLFIRAVFSSAYN